MAARKPWPSLQAPDFLILALPETTRLRRPVWNRRLDDFDAMLLSFSIDAFTQGLTLNKGTHRGKGKVLVSHRPDMYCLYRLDGNLLLYVWNQIITFSPKLNYKPLIEHRILIVTQY